MSLTMALAMFLSVVPVVNAQPQQNIQEVQMKQPKAQPEDAATEKADEKASKAEEAADKAEANGGTAEAGAADTATDDMLKDAADEGATDEDKPMAAAGQQTENVGIYKSLKTKFIEGNAGFMSLVALALVIGLAFCIERIIYLSLSEINAKKFMKSLDDKISANDIDGAKDCAATPVVLWPQYAIRAWCASTSRSTI